MQIDAKPRGLTDAPRDAVTLERAERSDHTLLANLLEFYIHDLSEVFAVQLGHDGRFGYPQLPTYWSDPQNRFAYLIRAGGVIAGFALAKIGSPLGTEPTDLDVSEFFVLRSQRRNGVGHAAAALLWDQRPGHWVVRVSEANRAGLAFWPEAVSQYTKGQFNERVVPGTPHAWRVFRFASRVG